MHPWGRFPNDGSRLPRRGTHPRFAPGPRRSESHALRCRARLRRVLGESVKTPSNLRQFEGSIASRGGTPDATVRANPPGACHPGGRVHEGCLGGARARTSQRIRLLDRQGPSDRLENRKKIDFTRGSRSASGFGSRASRSSRRVAGTTPVAPGSSHVRVGTTFRSAPLTATSNTHDRSKLRSVAPP